MCSFDGLNMFGMCFLEFWSIFHYCIYSAPQSTVCNRCSKTNPLHVEMHLAKQANCKNALIQCTQTWCRGPRTEAFAQINRTKMELQLETEQEVHFRSAIISLSSTTPQNPMEDCDEASTGLSPSPRRPNTLQRCCVCGWCLKQDTWTVSDRKNASLCLMQIIFLNMCGFRFSLQ